MEPEKIIETLKDRLEAESLDAFEICLIGLDRLSVEARNGEVESFSRVGQQGCAVRALKDHKIGWGSSTDFAASSLDRLVSSVVANVDEAAPSEESVIPKPLKARKGREKVINEIAEKKGMPLGEISESKKIAVALELERAAKEADPRIARVRQPLYEESIRQVVIYNSHGIHQVASRGIASCEVRAVAESNGQSESGWEFSFSPRFEDLDVAGTAKSAARRSLDLLGAAPLPTGRYDIIFEPRPASQLLRILVNSFFADNVQRGKSAIADKKGKAIYNQLITIVDDGLLPDGYASFPFDDEGVPRRKTTLVKEGVVTNWLYDTQRAARDGKLSTGSSHRPSIHKTASINISNCYIGAGDVEQAKLLSMAKKGFLVTDVMGLHTANPVTGDFSLGAEGFAIESGSKGRAVRGVIVAGNIHDLLKRVAAVGADLRFIANHGSPAILIPEVQVSGAG